MADFPDEVEYRRLRAYTVLTQAMSHEFRGQRVEAVAAAQKARSHFKELPLDQPQDRATLAYVCNNLGLWTEDTEKARELFDEALAVVEDDSRGDPPAAGALALNHESLTAFYFSINRLSSAEEHLREAVKRRLQLASTGQLAPQYRRGLARDYAALAEICARLGRRLEAEAECRKGLGLLEPLVRDRTHDRFTDAVLSENLLVLGKLQIQNQKTQEGIATLTRAIPPLEDLLQKAPDDNYVRDRLRQTYGTRAPALKSRGELFKAGRDWLRLQTLRQPPPDRTKHRP